MKNEHMIIAIENQINNLENIKRDFNQRLDCAIVMIKDLRSQIKDE